MCLCQINHVNVIPDTRTVRCVVIIAKYFQFTSQADSRLRNIWQKIIGHAIGQFTYLSRRMGTNRIEITQQNRRQGMIGIDSIRNDIFCYLFRIAVRRQSFLNRSILCYRQHIRLAVHCTG